ncbi:MAG: hypothetical protein QOF92_4320 [Pseudonocardiales bacterium]|jgi:hypothetical protein|nr:hypothetical protein [Pseudonocardiales bacterium]
MRALRPERGGLRSGGAGDEKPAERPVLTMRQVQALCMVVPPRFSAFIAVTTFASLRWGEVTALHRRVIDLGAGVITVRAAFIERSSGALELGPPKSRASVRAVALPRPVVAMLAAHLDAYVEVNPDALAFTGPTGRPLRRSNFNRAVRWREIWHRESGDQVRLRPPHHPKG